MTTEQILQMNLKQIEKLTTQELRQSVSTLRSTSRKRYERVVETGMYSPAVASLERKAEKNKQDVFSTVKGMTDEQLINEFKRYRQFLKNPTSTKKGTKQANVKLHEETEKVVDVGDVDIDDYTTDEWLHYYALVDEARKSDAGSVLDYNYAKNVVKELFNKNRHKRKDTREGNKRFNKKILKEAEKRLQEIYDKENTPRAVYPSKSIKK